jgi:hypothetical protein
VQAAYLHLPMTMVRRQSKGPVQRATGSFWTWVIIACSVYLWSKGQA